MFVLVITHDGFASVLPRALVVFVCDRGVGGSGGWYTVTVSWGTQAMHSSVSLSVPPVGFVMYLHFHTYWPDRTSVCVCVVVFFVQVNSTVFYIKFLKF